MDPSVDQRAATSYDAIPYRDLPVAHAHPRHMEAIAALFGLTPPPVTACRVLELGCAAGGNLIPQAQELSGSTFVGVDASARQISAGRQLVESLGLANIELRQADIGDITPDWGQFDYIISHGLFSWLPPALQAKVLEISARNLSPSGVAYVSYNTYPGWYQRGTVRELLRRHTAQFSDAQKKLEQAQVFLNFLLKSADADSSYGKLLREETALLEDLGDESYLFHEHLEEHNQPLFFHEFMDRAQAQRLQYVGDADFGLMLVQNLPPAAHEPLAKLPLLQQEQYIDFVRGRHFRKTLLCHQAVELRRALEPDQMERFYVAAANHLEAQNVNIRSATQAVFKTKKSTMTIANRLAKAALIWLLEIAPRFASFTEVYETALARVGRKQLDAAADEDDSRRGLAANLLLAFSVDVVEVCLHPPACVTPAGERPLTTQLARAQAQRGVYVTNQRHAAVPLHAMARQIVRRLDGSHDRATLTRCIQDAIRSGELTLQRGKETLRDPEAGLVADLVDRTLTQISTAGLLVG